jgi:hypothetical protein
LALSILDTNGIVLNADLVGLFPRMARMNHACGGQGGFNAVYSWRPNYVGSGELFVRAMTEIRKGDVGILFLLLRSWLKRDFRFLLGNYDCVYGYKAKEGGSNVSSLCQIVFGLEAFSDIHVCRKHLQDSYGFTCKCAVCSLQGPFSDESDRRLTKMAELEKEFATWKEGYITYRSGYSFADILFFRLSR